MPWGIAAAVVGGVIASDASKSAAHTQADAANNATDVQKAMYDQNTANVAPWMDAGKSSLGTLSKGVQDGTFNPMNYGPGAQLNNYGQAANQAGVGSTPVISQAQTMGRVGMAPNLTDYGAQTDLKAYKDYVAQNPFVGRGDFTADKFHQDPGYQFQLQQGMDALTNKASMAGGMNSNNLKGLVGYAEGMANTDYQQAFGNYQSEANRAQSEYNTGLQSHIQQFLTDQNTGTLNNNVTQQNNQNRIQTTGLNNQNINQNLQNRISATGFNNQAAEMDFNNQLTATNDNWKNQLAGASFNNQAAQQNFSNANTTTTLNNQVAGANSSDALMRQQLNNQNLQQQYANLATLSQSGMGAALQQGQIGTQVGQSIGNNIIGAGNANAAGRVGAANAVTGAIGSGYNSWLQNQYMQGGSGGGAYPSSGVEGSSDFIGPTF